MEKENKRKYESGFIPCGDALEKMELFLDDAHEDGGKEPEKEPD